MKQLTDNLRKTESYKNVLNSLRPQTVASSGPPSRPTPALLPKRKGDPMRRGDGDTPLWLKGLSGSSKALLLSALASDYQTTFLIILPSQDEAESLFHDLVTFGVSKFSSQYRFSDENKKEVLFFPQWPNFIYDGTSPPKRITAERMHCLEKLMKNRSGRTSVSSCVVVTSIRAVMHKIIPKQMFQSAFFDLQLGDEIVLDDVLRELMHGGYRRVNMVESKGEFAVRGGIFDVYPLTCDAPVRIELFGDEIESIRQFELATQRSVDELDSITISPTREVIPSSEVIEHWKDRTDEFLDKNELFHLRKEIEEITNRLEGGIELEGMEAFTSMFYPNPDVLLDYVPESTQIVMAEPAWSYREASTLISQMEKLYEKKIENNQFMPPPTSKRDACGTFEDFDEIMECLDLWNAFYIATAPSFRRNTALATKTNSNPPNEFDDAKVVDFDMHPLGLHEGNLQYTLNEMRRWRSEGYTINVFCDNIKQAERMENILVEHDLEIGTSVNVGVLSEGFIAKGLGQVVLSDDEIFARQRHRRFRRRMKFKEGAPILSIVDLKKGDYVVHITHGIGIYAGIKRLEIDEKQQDFLKLEYAGNDVLYVPTYQIDMVQKYVGGKDDVKLRLHRLGTATWKRAKERVRKSVEKLAKELVHLYAVRQSTPGHVFSADHPWQEEFEAAFPYEETPDQLQAIEEIKQDMERPRPMDRLVCGDVGYGKTEVAMRAAFKCVMDGKQVAVLVPTTVLAQQHFRTFSERFYDYPIKIEMLSRFRTQKEAKEVKRGLLEGKVDIVIGTHSLLSKSVKFKELGLLVIDEEHRFGVKHKETIKQLKKTVDVITMTATPIPRTLHMSLSGARDLSVINTPPENRFPIETYVIGYSPDIARDAILKEMDRGGQVFYVHNRVQGIESVASSVQNIVPEARIAVAHGQMSNRRLERIMLDFVDYEYDVLVCTTIIESGLDIPNVNTILINRADALGLAQLYQLRGRVGRDRYRAYGYLFYPRNRAITENAQKRLRVIEEYTELSSGFKIALRDLGIRGAGNILGPEQHGHIAAVGYDMYCKLLDEAVKKLSGEEVEEEFETKISVSVDAFLPDDYVPDSRQKVALYKKIAAISTYEDRKELEDELVDRYGKIPQPVYALLEVAELKQWARKLGIDAIIAGDDSVKISFDHEKTDIDPRRLIQLISENRRLSLLPSESLMFDLDEISRDKQLEVIKRLLIKLEEMA